MDYADNKPNLFPYIALNERHAMQELCAISRLTTLFNNIVTLDKIRDFGVWQATIENRILLRDSPQILGKNWSADRSLYFKLEMIKKSVHRVCDREAQWR